MKFVDWHEIWWKLAKWFSEEKLFSNIMILYMYTVQGKEKTRGQRPQFAHLSETATADMQMARIAIFFQYSYDKAMA